MPNPTPLEQLQKSHDTEAHTDMMTLGTYFMVLRIMRLLKLEEDPFLLRLIGFLNVLGKENAVGRLDEMLEFLREQMSSTSGKLKD